MIVKEYKEKLAVGSITKVKILEEMLYEIEKINETSFILELISSNQILQFNDIKEIIEFVEKNRVIHLFKLSIYNTNRDTISILSTSTEKNEWTIEYKQCEESLYNQINSTIIKFFDRKGLGIVRRKLETMVPLYLTLLVSSILLLILFLNSDKLAHPLGILFGYGFIVFLYSKFYEWYISKLSKSSIYLDSKNIYKEAKKSSKIKTLWKSFGIETKIAIISIVFTIISILLTILTLVIFSHG